MKVERFIAEYGNYRKKEIAHYLMAEEEKNKIIASIDKYIMLRSKGLITVAECIDGVLKA